MRYRGFRQRGGGGRGGSPIGPLVGGVILLVLIYVLVTAIF
jgi:hypothetical protein